MSRNTCVLGLTLFIGGLLCGSAQASPPDLLILGLHGEVAEFDTATCDVTTRSQLIFGLSHRDRTILVATGAVLGVDSVTTLTLYVTTEPMSERGDGLSALSPYGAAKEYEIVPYRVGSYERTPIYDRGHHTLAALPVLDANGQPSSGTLPLVAAYRNGQVVPANLGDLRFGNGFGVPARSFGVRTNAEMAAQFTSCAAHIMQTVPYQGWWTVSQFPKIRTYCATEEHYTTATVNLTSATLGIPHGYVLHSPIQWGPATAEVGGTSATAYVFLDRTTSTTTFFRHTDYSEPYTFDEAEAMMRCRQWIRPFAGGVSQETGVYDFYLRADHTVVECQVDPEMRVLYADRTRAYFARRTGTNRHTYDTSRSNELYRMSLSPQGCGQLERLPDLSFPPFMMFRIPWEDLP